ncbi:acyl-CoA dehydrogenase, N-terminal domain protein [Mycobacterium kansasii]|uniref:Acyl-CoA dehydrogenase, N-terminal domain protein n=1 Tax=Mycobacterium kansasii TaxID=1768 RepID=A0A1V3WPY5_MYCKA|nr:acyl-CoA dehydrogenase, N-terminal domain protein [Mycobacterium kansasii]
MSNELNHEEAMLVDTVRAFIDRDVKPNVREVEHANAYPEAWIEQMKRIGIFGLAVPEEYGGRRCRCRAMCRSPRSWPAAG